MTESLTAAVVPNHGSEGLLSVSPDAPVDDGRRGGAGLDRGGGPAGWVEAGRRGGPAAVREVRTRAEYEAWYPVFGRSGLVAATWPRAYGGLDLSPAAARRVEQELAPVQSRPAEPPGTQPGRARPVRARDRGTAAALPPPDRPQRGGLVPAVQRAGCRFRPRVPGHPGRARRRGLGHHRSEGVDHVGAPLGLGRAARAHRRRRAETRRG